MVLAAVGCGNGRPGLTPAVGKVTLNGEPLADALVFVQPVQTSAEGFRRPASATTDAQGVYQLGTYDKGDGVPPGKYEVGVIKKINIGKQREPGDERPDPPGAKYQWIVPEPYSHPESSGLTIEVTSSGITPETLELKRLGDPQVTIPGQPGGNVP